MPETKANSIIWIIWIYGTRNLSEPGKATDHLFRPLSMCVVYSLDITILQKIDVWIFCLSKCIYLEPNFASNFPALQM